MRSENHPILGESAKTDTFIYVDGRKISAVTGETIAAAMTAAGIKVMRYTQKHHHPRGVYCYSGRCSDCCMIVDGIPNVKTCITEVREGMQVKTQHGLGDFNDIRSEGEA